MSEPSSHDSPSADALPYEVEARETVAETPDLRVIIFTLGPGQCVPWHYHSNVTDTFFCLEGPMVVETRVPGETRELVPGQTCAVPPKRAHQVSGKNGGHCRFAVVQGVGRYDFQPAGRPGA